MGTKLGAVKRWTRLYPTWQNRFWSKVSKLESECWVWTASTDDWGYGQFVMSDSRKAKAHRVSWELNYGQIPNGLKVLHKCDNPPCVNPQHLFLGTDEDNLRDAIKKGRFPANIRKGSKHGMAKLDEETAIQICKEYEGGNTTLKRLGKKHGVSFGNVWKILNGYNWTHVTGIKKTSKESILPAPQT